MQAQARPQEGHNTAHDGQCWAHVHTPCDRADTGHTRQAFKPWRIHKGDDAPRAQVGRREFSKQDEDPIPMPSRNEARLEASLDPSTIMEGGPTI